MTETTNPATSSAAPAKKPIDWNNLNLFAVLSLVLSATGIHLPGIVLGHIALLQIKSSGQNGRGMAIAGLVLGYVAFAFVAIFFGAMFVLMILSAARGNWQSWT